MGNGINKKRIWELDLARGIALILMIYFHTIYDMKEIYGYNLNYESGINYYIGKLSAITFIVVSGVSCSLSRNNLKRGLKILLLAMAVTLATQLYNPELVIKFGILHFLGVCIILSPVLKKMSIHAAVISAAAVIITGLLTRNIAAPNNYLFVLGITSGNFKSADYYPLMPWLGVFLSGLALGKSLYREKRSIFSFGMRDNLLNMAGRHTLLLYLLHQPLIIVVLTALQMVYSLFALIE